MLNKQITTSSDEDPVKNDWQGLLSFNLVPRAFSNFQNGGLVSLNSPKRKIVLGQLHCLNGGCLFIHNKPHHTVTWRVGNTKTVAMYT